jgi:sugar diacid utilization regulator
MDALNNLLEPFNGHAIISRATSHYEMFKTLYQLSHRMLEILMKMHMLSEYGRIYHYSDYTIYLAIDFCAQYYQNYTGHSDIIYLADPAIIRLTRYDTEHKTELRDVLFYHLLNGRNVAKTAKIMYMHRNTILNKLNKINQLIELPLEDGRTQQQLLFSCQIVKYYTEYLCLELT